MSFHPVEYYHGVRSNWSPIYTWITVFMSVSYTIFMYGFLTETYGAIVTGAVGLIGFSLTALAVDKNLQEQEQMSDP